MKTVESVEMLASATREEIRERLAGPLPNAAGLCALVIGMGDSGQAVADLLLREGARALAHEANVEKAESLRRVWETRGVRILTGAPQTLDGIDFAVISPGVPPTNPVVERLRDAGLYITGEMELGSRYLRRPILAVTGSKGKTTVVAMLHHILSVLGYTPRSAGNEQIPVAQVAAHEKRVSRDPLVFEVSSFQCETFEEFHPRVGVITLLAPDHQDRYESLEAYYEVKFRIARNQAPTEALWLGPRVEGYCPEWVPSRIRSFDLDRMDSDGLFYHDGALVLRDDVSEERVPAPSWAGTNRIALLNRLAAMGAAVSFGAPLRATMEALRNFKGLPHRMELFTEANGIQCVNDSKATSVAALRAALESLPGPVRLIAGGQAKGEIDLSGLASLVREKVIAAYLIGRDAWRFEAAWSGMTEIHLEESIEDAARHALEDGRPGETLLLSPACASWDMFNGYAERGDRFKAAVRGWAS